MPVPVESNGSIPSYIMCDGELVNIDSLVPDPMNARLHPNRNRQAIRQSLQDFGQREPLVVRSENNMIAAGNGRHAEMKALGWTKVAISRRPMTDAEFYRFALADNRSGDLASFDMEKVAKVDELLAQLNAPGLIGYTNDELEVVRAASWTPPAIVDNDRWDRDRPTMLTLEQKNATVVLEAVGQYRIEVRDDKRSEADCLAAICSQWLMIVRATESDPLSEMF